MGCEALAAANGNSAAAQWHRHEGCKLTNAVTQMGTHFCRYTALLRPPIFIVA